MTEVLENGLRAPRKGRSSTLEAMLGGKKIPEVAIPHCRPEWCRNVFLAVGG